jgi:Tfp pilus assembly protein PilV
LKRSNVEAGFSLIETIVASAIIVGLTLASVSQFKTNKRALKTIDQRKYLYKLNLNLGNALEDDQTCYNFFNPLLPSPFYWRFLSTGPDAVVNSTKTNAAISSLGAGLVNFDVGTQDNGNMAKELKITSIRIPKAASVPPGPAGTVFSLTLPVYFGITKPLNVNFRSNTYLTQNYLSKDGTTIVFNFIKTTSGFFGSIITLKSCYARGSALMSEAKELCNTIGGSFSDVGGCKFPQFVGNGGNFNQYLASSVATGGDSIQIVLCEIEKKVMEVEKTGIPAVTDPGGNVVIPAIPAKPNPISKYCTP